MAKTPSSEPLALGVRAPLARNLPVLVLLLLAGAATVQALGAAIPGVGLRGRLLGMMAALLVAAVVLARGRGFFGLVTSLPFAAAQLAALAVAGLAGAVGWIAAPLDRLGGLGLLGLLALSALAVAWKRRPYRPSRIGFLLVHLAPALLAAGAFWRVLGPGADGTAARILLRAGWLLLLAGMAWMFWLKPPLKRRERGEAP